ncbi:unnamed protein product [Prorocentrum cordatum]|uniref:Uncharacterized protein n=1 Tax=Prorocentrum cordatum TaxID=2364126 RepID=A0ABN9WC12_9DINO|nr:unnamed protein product [Polarella glacialis]
MGSLDRATSPMHRRRGSMRSPVFATPTAAIHRRCMADALAMHRRCGACLRPHLLRPPLGGLCVISAQGIIALLHALLNAGLLGAPGGTVAGHWPEGGPMRRWLEALPPSASPADRGRALVNDVGIRAIYRTHATGGQSRMPLSPIWTWVTLLPALAWVVSAAWVLFARGTKVLSIYLCFSLACLLVCALIWRLSGGRCPCGGWSATSCASPSGRGACCSWTGSQTPPRTSEPARAPSRAPRWSSFAARCCRRCPGRTRVPSWPCPRQRRSPEGTAAGFRWVLLRARPRASGGFS